MFQSVQKIKKLDWPNFTAEPDVEFSGFSKDINIVSIGWEPAAILNVKHDARRLNAFLTCGYSLYWQKWRFLGWCSNEYKSSVKDITEMDVDFNALPDNAATIFRGWVPAALLNVKHDARKELCQKTCF